MQAGPQYETRLWTEIKKGDVIICPVTMLEELVRESRPYLKDLWFIAAPRHNHSPARTGDVQVRR